MEHIPVMLEEVIENLKPKTGGIYVDGTLGLGGHAKEILKRIGPQGRLIGIERDSKSLSNARENLGSFLEQCQLVQSNFRDINQVLDSLKIHKVDGILLDLGISSYQLDDPQRGFGFKTNGPLDMRMNQDEQKSAADLVNESSQEELIKVIKEFGEERYAKRIAQTIVRERRMSPIKTTQELRQIILKSVPGHYAKYRIDPATRTFQALRIAVNRELDALKEVVAKSVECLNVGGRLCVISFHSLEDRIVKQSIRDLKHQGKLERIVKKPLRPNAKELFKNPRARSARLRVAERI